MHIERLDRFGNIFSYYGLKVNILNKKRKIRNVAQKIGKFGKTAFSMGILYKL